MTRAETDTCNSIMRMDAALEEIQRDMDGVCHRPMGYTDIILNFIWFAGKTFEKEQVANWLLPVYRSLQNPEEWTLNEDGRLLHARTGLLIRIKSTKRWWSGYSHKMEILAPVRIEADRLGWRVHWTLGPMGAALQCRLLHDLFSEDKTFRDLEGI